MRDLPTPADAEMPDTILLVEDNFIIAMDTADMLEEAGCPTVLSAPDVPTAMAHLNGPASVGCAILDINLGSGTSLPVAEALDAAGIPFLLTTGYGSDEEVRADYPTAPILPKPFSQKDLLRAVSDLALSSETGDV